MDQWMGRETHDRTVEYTHKHPILFLFVTSWLHSILHSITSLGPYALPKVPEPSTPFPDDVILEYTQPLPDIICPILFLEDSIRVHI